MVYGISNNTRAFWSLANARSVLGYEPEDDAEIKFAEDVAEFQGERGRGHRLRQGRPASGDEPIASGVRRRL